MDDQVTRSPYNIGVERYLTVPTKQDGLLLVTLNVFGKLFCKDSALPKSG